MDKMLIKGLVLECIIGTKPIERKKKQKLIIDIILELDLKPAAKSDNLADTVNYKTLAKEIIALVTNSRFFLIERLADRIASTCLKNRRVKCVTVNVGKPGALNKAQNVAVEITRKR
ncbi:MAG: dihydroneopterin aldolase [Kiritimatiellae bacterium]|nr:dihydroneopterin aldolase [Kiritimatiellia bacterium]MDD5521214.1 dihydroneopterin aldolase [Kiritimatiellia bacterium]